MTAPDSRDSVERVVAEMQHYANGSTSLCPASVIDKWADRLQALTRQFVAGDGVATCKGPPLQISEATGRVDLFETARKVARLGEHGSDGDESYDELASEIDQEILAAAYEREEVDREVRGSRIFYFRHNPPNTLLAQIFNNILLANGTYEIDHAKHAAREEAARSQLGVLAAAPAATPENK